MKNVFLKYGVMYGLTGFVSTLLYYHGVLGMGLNLMLGMGVLFLLLWLAGKEFKSKNEGYASFGDLLKLYFMTILVGILLNIVLTAVYNNVISEDQKAEIVARMVESTMAMTKMMVTDEAVLAEMQEKMEEDFSIEKFFGIKATITNLFSALFGAIIFALIGAAIFKKVPKEMA